MNLDLIGQMSCNPAIGGIAKGHLVREIDALGGIMARVADRTGIHFSLVESVERPRGSVTAGSSRPRFIPQEMRLTLEATSNLHLRQGMVVDLTVRSGKVCGVELQDGRKLGGGAVVVATGTFLNGLVHTGRRSYSAGRAAEPASIELAEALRTPRFSRWSG
jgi:tRNA uridine 5-carboxymethylaminomethyl modification enzyme